MKPLTLNNFGRPRCCCCCMPPATTLLSPLPPHVLCVPSFSDTTCNPIQSDTTAPLTLSYHSLARLVVASDTSSPPLYNLYERAATGIGRERRRRRSSAASARRSTCWPSICQYNALSSPPRSAARALQQRGEGRQPASAIAAESTLWRESTYRRNV